MTCQAVLKDFLGRQYWPPMSVNSQGRIMVVAGADSDPATDPVLKRGQTPGQL
jgi:hypothetical protein